MIYRIEPSGTWEQSGRPAISIYDVAATDDGGVLVATGPEGRLFKVERTREVLLLTGVDAKQITRFASGGTPKVRRLSAFATANAGPRRQRRHRRAVPRHVHLAACATRRASPRGA